MSGDFGPTGMMVIQGNRIESLRSVMTEWIRRYPLAPLQSEQILVQSNGIAQWLNMALAADNSQGGLSIAAANNMQLPARFLWQVYRSFDPVLPHVSPFDKAPLTWLLYGLLEEPQQWLNASQDPSLFAPILNYLRKDDDPARIHQLSSKLASLYDQYQVYRPDWLLDWKAGKNNIRKTVDHKEVAVLHKNQLWQPELWRMIHRQLAEGSANSVAGIRLKSRAEVHANFLRQCRLAESPPKLLPPRVIVFGISALPPILIEMLVAISKFSQVLLFVNNPSQHYWGDLIEGKSWLKGQIRNRDRLSKGNDKLTTAPLDLPHLQPALGNPLLAAWGKQGKDYLSLLDEYDQPQQYRNHFQSIDLFESPLAELKHKQHPTLLQQLQEDIFELRDVSERVKLNQTQQRAKNDASIEFIQAHSAQREVEILHDMLLNEFEQAHLHASDLDYQNILIMVPDINQYAPHIQAVFGRFESSNPRYIPFHISDQTSQYNSSLLKAFRTLLNAVEARFTLTEVQELLQTEAIQERFNIKPDQMGLLLAWFKGSNIRWGLTTEHRNDLGFADLGEQNSWLFGLKRMLLGYATGNTDSWQDILPYSEVAGLEASLLGALYEFVSKLCDLQLSLQQQATAQQWQTRINQLCSDFFDSSQVKDDLTLSAIAEILQTWCEQIALAGEESLSFPVSVFKDQILNELDKPSLFRTFFAGSVNFANLMPMRAIPFKQIWMLGMNDADYPRKQSRDDFDLMFHAYRPGDRSRREDDRYLFLEAILSARKKLVISWVGREIKDNSIKPPSVLVGQLRDYLAQGWGGETAAQQQDFLTSLTVVYPLQPFSREYFRIKPTEKRLFTYATEWRQAYTGVQQSQSESLTHSAFFPEQAVHLGVLSHFLHKPLNSFYQNRLKVSQLVLNGQIDEDEPFVVEGLNAWNLRDQLVTRLNQAFIQLATVQGDLQTLIEQELVRSAEQLRLAGELPPSALSIFTQERLIKQLLPAYTAYRQWQIAYPIHCKGELRQLTVSVDPILAASDAHPPKPMLIEGFLADYRKSDHKQQQAVRLLMQSSVLTKSSQLRYDKLVRYWPDHLFAQLDQPTTTLLFEPDSEEPVGFAALDSEIAKEHLLSLALQWLDAMQTPAPLACKTALAWLTKQSNPQTVYEDNYNSTAEVSSHHGYSRFWPDFSCLTQDGRFAELAEILYQPIIDNVDHFVSSKLGTDDAIL
jgi:exodeoxyribonuclease V gamma subunit